MTTQELRDGRDTLGTDWVRLFSAVLAANLLAAVVIFASVRLYAPVADWLSGK
jgi:hypothetical protein